MTALEKHFCKYKNGCGSEACSLAQNICLVRGKVPADILFIGEAPGESEDCLAIPFVGPAGQLLDHIIETSGGNSYRVAFTNIVGCIPRNPSDLSKYEEPSLEQVVSCIPRAVDLIKLVHPKLIVAVGKVAESYLQQGLKHSIPFPYSGIHQTTINHPAAILRANIANQSIMIQRCVVTLRNTIREYLC